MTDFGLGDDISNEAELKRALAWHGLIEKPETEEKEHSTDVSDPPASNSPSWQ